MLIITYIIFVLIEFYFRLMKKNLKQNFSLMIGSMTMLGWSMTMQDGSGVKEDLPVGTDLVQETQTGMLRMMCLKLFRMI